MKVEIELDASQVSAEFGEVLASLTDEQKTEIAVQVIGQKLRQELDRYADTDHWGRGLHHDLIRNGWNGIRDAVRKEVAAALVDQDVIRETANAVAEKLPHLALAVMVSAVISRTQEQINEQTNAAAQMNHTAEALRLITERLGI